MVISYYFNSLMEGKECYTGCCMSNIEKARKKLQEDIVNDLGYRRKYIIGKMAQQIYPIAMLLK